MKVDDKDFLMNLGNSDLTKIFIIINKYFLVFDIIKKYNLPKCIYFTIIFVIMNYKYQDNKNIDKINKKFIEKHKNTFNNFNFIEHDNIDLNNNIKLLKSNFNKMIKTNNIKNLLKEKTIPQLREITKKNFIKNISEIKRKSEYLQVLTTYHSKFGLVF